MAMKKMKAIFFFVSLAVFILILFLLNQVNFSVAAPLAELPANASFQVTNVSENGNLYQDVAETQLLDIRLLSYPNELFLKGDKQTAFEFFFKNWGVIALPGSQVVFQKFSNTLTFGNGEYFWDKKTREGQLTVTLLKPENTMSLSDSGRIRLRSNSLQVWDYVGQLDLNWSNVRYHLKSAQTIIIGEKERAQVVDLLPTPKFISPEAETIALKKPGNTIIPFRWEYLPGVSSYLIRIYPSYLKENVLLSRVESGNSANIDISPFLESSELCWDVCAYDANRDIESQPSRIGVIRITGALARSEYMPRPPQIVIDSLSVSGYIVLVKGTTELAEQLLVDDVPVKMGSDGRFTHTISYKTIGVKEIIFKVISASGLETVVKRQVTIYEEISE